MLGGGRSAVSQLGTDPKLVSALRPLSFLMRGRGEDIYLERGAPPHRLSGRQVPKKKDFRHIVPTHSIMAIPPRGPSPVSGRKTRISAALGTSALSLLCLLIVFTSGLGSSPGGVGWLSFAVVSYYHCPLSSPRTTLTSPDRLLRRPDQDRQPVLPRSS